MTTFNITEHEKQIVYKSLLFQRQELKRQLDDIDGLINKYKNENQLIAAIAKPTSARRSSSDDSVIDKVLEVLKNIDYPLTSRQILEGIKTNYIEIKELSKEDDRKYMARVSASISNKMKDGTIDKIKEDGKDPVYFIKKEQP